VNAHRKRELPDYVAGLLRPEAYDHPADDLAMQDTHISWIILAGQHAYKLKKPVDLGFVDFSSRQRREQDCAQEVRLNRRLCPDVYLGVVNVVAHDGSFRIGGTGRPIEPAVHMRRLPQTGMLPNLLARRRVDARLLRRIARRLARFHATAPTGPGIDEFGDIRAVRKNWDENFQQTEVFVGQTLPRERRDHIREFVHRFLPDQAGLLRRRVATGRVRDGHGDLHAASICIEGRRIHLFDCIEFAARFRCGDVAAEVAFLAMDLDHHSRADLSDAFIGTYGKSSGDAELCELLDFYRCYRAYVRGKVLSLRLAEPGLTSRESAQIADEASAYFDLAWAYAGGLTGSTLVMVMGPPASGKTSLAVGLAGRLGLVHLSSDVVRKELAGRAPDATGGDAFGEGIYVPAMTRRTYASLSRRAAYWLRGGHSVVLDATYGRPEQRAAVRQLARRMGAGFVALFCRASDDVLRRRLAAREHESAGVSDARLELWPELRAAFVDPRDDMPEVSTISTSGPLRETVAQAMNVICDRVSM
jgi:uncharacterized protein